jgi:hypothetical protein
VVTWTLIRLWIVQVPPGGLAAFRVPPGGLAAIRVPPEGLGVEFPPKMQSDPLAVGKITPILRNAAGREGVGVVGGLTLNVYLSMAIVSLIIIL